MADLRTRIVITSSDQTASGIRSARLQLTGLDNAVKQVKSSLLALTGVGLGVGLVKSIADTADRMTELEGRLKVVVDGEKELIAVQDELFASSQRTGSAFQQNVDLFTRLQPAIEQLGGDYQTTIQLTETIAQSLRLSGASASEAAGLTTQLSQALQSGVLRGDEFNSVVENGGYLARQLADGLGVTVGELRNMAFQGQLTSDVVINTLLKQSAAINEEFGKIPETLGTAFTKLNNAWQKFLGNFDSASGASSTVAELVATIAENFSKLANAAIKVGQVIVAVYAVKAVKALATMITVQIQTIAANRAAAVAALQAAEAEVARTAAIVRNLEVLAAQLRALIAEAAATTDVTATKWALLNVEGKLLAAREANTAAIAAQTTAARGGAAVLLSFGSALNIALAGFAGFKLGEWLFQEFVIVKKIGASIVEFFVLMGTAIKGALNLDVGTFDELRRVHEEFNDLRQSYEDAAVAAEKSRRIEEINNQIAKSFEAVKKSVEEVGEVYEKTFEQSKESLDQRYKDNLASIERLGVNERQRQALVTQEIIRSGDEQARLAKQYAESRARLIEKAYNEEIKATSQKTNAVLQMERESASQRLQIYEGLAQSYRGIIDKLISEEKRWLDRARDYARQRANLNRSTEERITEFRRAGLSETARQADIVREREELYAKVAQAKAEEKYEDVLKYTDRIKKLSFESANIAKDIEKTTGKLDKQAQIAMKAGIELIAWENNQKIEKLKTTLTETSAQAIQNVKDASALENEALAALESQAKAAAQAARDSYTTMQSQLETTQAKIKALLDDLQKQTISEHKVNIDAEKALATIEQLKQPTQSTHTVNVVENNNGQARRFGGPILKFNSGGHTPMTGQLPGFGGGDRIKALLEAGEFIIRKEAVQKYGGDLFENLNAMRVQPEKIIRRQSGGLIPIQSPRLAIVRRQSGGIIPVQKFARGGSVSSFGAATNVKLLADFDIDQASIDSTLRKFAGKLDGFLNANLSLSNLQFDRDIKDINVKVGAEISDVRAQFATAVSSIEDNFKQVFDRAGQDFAKSIEGINLKELSFNQSADDAIRNILREGMTEEEQYVDRVKELREKEQAAKQALARGDVEEAQRLNQEILSLAQSISTEVTDSAGNIIVQQQDAAATALEFLNNAKNLNGQIASAERDIERQNYNDKITEIETEKQAEISAITQTLNSDLAAIETSKAAAIAAAAAEHAVRMENIKKEQQARIASFLTEARNYQTVMSSMSFRLTSQLNRAAATGATNRAMDSVRQSGLFFADGGGVPGTGDGDTVPAMLTPGEFVIKKSSVVRHGLSFLHALNNGQLPKFNVGGLVGASNISSSIMNVVNNGMAPVRKFAAGGPVGAAAKSDAAMAISLALNGAKANGTLERGSATDELIEQLKLAGIVS